MNIPNRLTCLRMIMIPIFLVFMLMSEVFGDTTSRIVATIIFLLASFTDMLDGKIARKYGLVTDFGKFMDPLADKLMVFGAMIGILVMNREFVLFSKVFAAVTFVIIFRELAVTSMRLVVSNSEGIVVAANIFGKLKTVSQIIGIAVIILEPIFFEMMIGSYIASGVMVLTTLFSGYSYFKAYWGHINTNK